MFNWDKMSLTQRLIWLKNRANGGSGEFGELATVEGYTPLTLPDAAAKNIKSLTVRGKIEATGDPSPSDKQEIITNLGYVTTKHQSGLPTAINLLDSIGASGTSYINTARAIRNTDKIIAEFRNSSTSGVKALYGAQRTGYDCSFYAGGTYYAVDKNNNKVDTGIPVDTEWHRVEHDFSNGTLKLDDTTVYFEPYEFEAGYALAIFARRDVVGYTMGFLGEIRSFKIIRDGEVIFNCLPVKAISEIGLYDFVTTGGFYFVPSGTGTAGSKVLDPVILTTDQAGDTSLAVYVNTSRVDIQPLYATPDYADEQEAVSGVITRRIGYHIFTGEETWRSAQNGWITEDITDQLNAVYTPVCSHFGGVPTNPTADSNTVRVYWTDGGNPRVYFGVDKTRFNTAQVWNEWLQEKIKYGSPVILLYPLAEPKTERVKRQFPKTAKGVNKVEASEIVTTYKTIQYYKAIEE